MRYSLRLGIAICLICNASLFAEINLTATGQNQGTGKAPGSQSQDTPTNGQNLPTTPPGGVTPPTGLAKVCSEKIPPPCATPPRVVFAPAAQFSEEARKKDYQGVCTLSVIVEADGRT